MTTHNQRNGCIDLRHGDALDVLRTLPDASIDAIVTDPPYELGFMGKKWDGSGIAYSVDLWREALRVLKPGGHLVAFGGTRTYHRMACAVEDAGFEIRDSLTGSWVGDFRSRSTSALRS
jgi:DNA modification methylase